MGNLHPQTQIDFARADGETFMVKRLGQHGVRVFDGVTDTASRMALVRAAIIGGAKDCAIVGRNPATHKPETYAQLFERVYGEPLYPQAPKRKTSTLLKSTEVPP